jgi:hypothetical protein
MATLPPARPHGELREVFDNVFFVTGTLSIGPVAAGRCMTVLKQGDELTILNSVRLNDDGEKQLAKLGTVKHLVRLGWFHGMDDPYYMQRYSPTFWSGKRVVPVNVDASRINTLVDGMETPFGRVHHFAGGEYDETAALLTGSRDKVLVTCDAIQNVVDTSDCNFLGGLMLRVFGLVGGVRVGPPWLKKMSKGKPQRMRADFDRLLALDFASLVAGHGKPLANAKAAVAADVEARVPKPR